MLTPSCIVSKFKCLPLQQQQQETAAAAATPATCNMQQRLQCQAEAATTVADNHNIE